MAESPKLAIPAQRKRLAIFLDGTWNVVGDNTNVWRLKSLCAPVDAGETRQLAYYERGVNGFLGGMFGEGLDQNITDAYQWLIDNYEAADDIFIFGFSRGAYTARSLAGFIAKCGLLKSGAPLGVKQPHRFDVGMVDLKRFVGDCHCGFHRLTLYTFRAGQIDDCLTRLLRRQCIEFLSSVQLALQFRNVAEIVQGEGIVWIKQVGLIKQPFGLGIIVLANSLDSFAIQSLYGRQMAALGDIDPGVFRLRLRSEAGGDQTEEKPNLTKHGDPHPLQAKG